MGSQEPDEAWVLEIRIFRVQKLLEKSITKVNKKELNIFKYIYHINKNSF